MFIEGINKKFKCEMCLENSKFINRYLIIKFFYVKNFNVNSSCYI